MYRTSSITDEQLLFLKKLIDKADPPVGAHLEKIATVTGIGDDNSDRFDIELLNLHPLGTFNNPELLEWLENYTGIESKYITNLHVNTMQEGAYFLPHIDNYHLKVSETFTFLLDKPVTGGEFILDGRNIDINCNKVLIFNGGRYPHGVRKVKKGIRKSFIVFYDIPNQNKPAPLL